MNKESTLQQKLLSYSSIAGAVLATGVSANAQIIYHDIEPDFQMVLGDTFLLDLNGDGTFDYGIDSRKNVAHTADKVEIWGPNSNNFVDAYTGPYGFYYANALTMGDPIGDSNHWLVANNNYVTMAFMYSAGTSTGAWLGVTDGYCALKFTVGGNVYYGWVRMDVAATADSATIKDYAYNATAGAGLNAGETGGVGVPVQPNHSWIILAEGKQLILQKIPFSGELHVINAIGIDQFQSEVKQGESKFDLSQLSDGIYIVRIQFESGRLTKKIMLK